MNAENDHLLEADRLDEFLETPAQAQPVVVVQYRNRGVPSWIFFPLIFAVPLAAIVVYHRMVAERYRVQAAQANSLLEREIADARASLPLARNDAPPTTVLPQPRADAFSTDADPVRSAADSSSTTTVVDGAKAKLSVPGTESAAPTPPAAAASSPPARTDQAVVAQAAPPVAAPVSPPAAPEQAPKITMRSILPNPFADLDSAPRPPAPGRQGGSAPGADQRGESPAGAVTASLDQASGGEARTQDPVENADKKRARPDLAELAAARAQAPLPTREESEQQIREEAARREAEIAAQNEGKSVEMRAQRLEEQVKFRNELGELIRSQGNRAGPDIEALSKRYGYEAAPEKMFIANRAWRTSRKSQADKVRLVRSLELPEPVVLGFLFDDIYRTKGRNGPRNDGEVHVLAAKQLLRYPLPGTGASRPPAARASVGNPPAGAHNAAPKTIVSTPR
jgi:hypothetical protein